MYAHVHSYSLAFVVGGIDFEDVRLTGEEFAAAKASGAFKNGTPHADHI
jgi:hypothetical protein